MAAPLIDPTTMPAISAFVNAFVSVGDMVVVAGGGETVLSAAKLEVKSVVTVEVRTIFVDMLEVNESMVWLDEKIGCSALVAAIATGVL